MLDPPIICEFPDMASRLPEVHFRCLKCGYEYAKGLGDLTEEQFAMEDQEPILDDCPKCGAKGESRQMFKCPKCEKYYLPKWCTYPKGTFVCFDVGGDICEHCNLDVDKWNIEEAMRRKK